MNSSNRLLLLSLIMILFITISINHSSLVRGDDDDDENDFSDKDVIQICCAWGYELADGLLTYSIEADDDNDDYQYPKPGESGSAAAWIARRVRVAWRARIV